MDKLLILFSMKGCPFCEQIKSSLTESKIDFVERDIDDYKEEYDLFVEATDNEFVPAFMIIDEVSESPKTFLYAPERDFQDLPEGVEIIKRHFNIV